MPKERDGIWLGGYGADLWGEHNAAQIHKNDKVNDYLLEKYLNEYIEWHKSTHRFHETYDSDMSKQKRLIIQKWAWASVGFCFGAIIINPNFTHRHSYYLRRTWPLVMSAVGYQWGKKVENENMTMTLMRMNDYFPLEVKRALQTKDFRHLAAFDYKNPGRTLFDEATGKSLS